ncbi:MAG: 1-phosphofructokinase [Acutalibacteraceae bacterium]
MIYTVTFNPAIDYVVLLDKFNFGEVNRTTREYMNFGGKGINVSIMLSHLGIENVSLGFVAGFTGTAIETGLREKGIKTDFVHLKEGNTRINVKIKGNVESEINAQGPAILEEDIEKLFKKLDLLKSGDTLILAGSIPSSLPEDIYEKILSRLENKNIRFVVDATKDLLVNVLKYKPFLIKPNNHELEEIFGVKLTTVESIAKYAKKLQEMGAKNVLISMAKDGALLVDESGNIHQINAPKGKTVNSVGAGDSMVAGFVAGYLEKHDYLYALKLGTASGSASAFSEYIATKEEVYNLLKKI